MKKLAPLLIILGGAFWGMSGLFVRFLSGFGLNSLQISCIRIISAAVIMFFIVLLKDRKLFKIQLKDLWIFICGGAFSVFLTCVSYFNTISLASLSVACILMYTAPVFVMIASFFIFKEKISGKKVIAMLLAFFGCVCVSGILEGDSSNVSTAALVSGLISGITYASYSIFGKLALRKYSPLTYTLYSFIFAAVAALFAVDGQTIIGAAQQNTFLIWFYPLTGFMISVIPYLLYTLGLSGMESGPASVLSCVEPLVATLIGIFILSEPMSLISIAGICLIVSSIVILR